MIHVSSTTLVGWILEDVSLCIYHAYIRAYVRMRKVGMSFNNALSICIYLYPSKG